MVRTNSCKCLKWSTCIQSGWIWAFFLNPHDQIARSSNFAGWLPCAVWREERIFPIVRPNCNISQISYLDIPEWWYCDVCEYICPPWLSQKTVIVIPHLKRGTHIPIIGMNYSISTIVNRVERGFTNVAIIRLNTVFSCLSQVSPGSAKFGLEEETITLRLCACWC